MDPAIGTRRVLWPSLALPEAAVGAWARINGGLVRREVVYERTGEGLSFVDGGERAEPGCGTFDGGKTVDEPMSGMARSWCGPRGWDAQVPTTQSSKRRTFFTFWR